MHSTRCHMSLVPYGFYVLLVFILLVQKAFSVLECRRHMTSLHMSHIYILIYLLY